MARAQNLINEQISLLFNEESRSRLTLPGFSPYYSTDLGDAYVADSLEVLKAIPDGSINAVITSPPYACTLRRNTATPKSTITLNGFFLLVLLPSTLLSGT